MPSPLFPEVGQVLHVMSMSVYCPTLAWPLRLSCPSLLPYSLIQLSSLPGCRRTYTVHFSSFSSYGYNRHRQGESREWWRKAALHSFPPVRAFPFISILLSHILSRQGLHEGLLWVFVLFSFAGWQQRMTSCTVCWEKSRPSRETVEGKVQCQFAKWTGPGSGLGASDSSTNRSKFWALGETAFLPDRPLWRMGCVTHRDGNHISWSWEACPSAHRKRGTPMSWLPPICQALEQVSLFYLVLPTVLWGRWYHVLYEGWD